MIMRVAMGIHDRDLDKAFKTYHMIFNRLFTHATPTLFNAGTPTPQLSSCFLTTMQGDIIDGIYDTVKQTATISNFSNGMADESAPSDEAASALSSGHQAQDPEEISCEQGLLGALKPIYSRGLGQCVYLTPYRIVLNSSSVDFKLGGS
eukprot:jgi/Tetstr1/434693/TSEL_002520.t1